MSSALEKILKDLLKESDWLLCWVNAVGEFYIAHAFPQEAGPSVAIHADVFADCPSMQVRRLRKNALVRRLYPGGSTPPPSTKSDFSTLLKRAC